jgi:hypothetical protein
MLYPRRLEAEGREIRLLSRIHTSPDGIVECSLENASLDDGPKFAALSYVWGNPSDTTLIRVNGEEFQATENLEQAL